MLRYWRKTALISLVIVLSLSALAVPATAQDDNFVVVDTGNAHIRSGPSYYTTSLGTVPGGTELPVTGRTLTGSWWRVDSEFGEGWVSGEITAFRGTLSTVPVVDEPPGTPEDPTVFVDTYPVTVYRNPDPDSFVIGIAPQGAVMVVTGITADAFWYRVDTVMGSGFLLVEEVAFRGNPQAVPLAEDPGPSFDGPTIRVNVETPVTTEPGGGEVLGTLPAGDVLPTGGRSEDNSWWYVAEDFGVGWIPVSNVSLSGAASNIRVTSDATTPGPAYTGATFATIVIESPRKIAYKEDSFGSPPMWDAGHGEECSVLARSLDGLWLKVVNDNYEGWMHFSGITLVGAMADIPPVDTSPPPIPNFAIVNTSWLNIRSGPDVKYERIGAAKGGDHLEVTGRHPTLTWLRVEGDYGIGWVQSEFIIFRGDWPAVPVVTEPIGDLELPTAVIDFPHNVYAEPDFDFFIGTIEGGTYPIVGWNQALSWALIETDLGDVWISSEEFLMRGIAQNAPIVD